MPINKTDYSPARWKALGVALRARRDELGWSNRRDFCNPVLHPGAVSYSLVNDLERGQLHTYETQTVVRIEQQYGLAAGALVGFLSRADRKLRIDQGGPAAEAAADRADRDKILAELGISRDGLDATIDTLTKLREATRPAAGLIPAAAAPRRQLAPPSLRLQTVPPRARASAGRV